jgi:hypothetical protein
LLIFTDIAGVGVRKTRDYMNYILVYNEGKNPLPDEFDSTIQISPSREHIAKYFINDRSKKAFGFIRFNLERFKKLYFKNVFTLTESEFETEFVSKFS